MIARSELEALLGPVAVCSRDGAVLESGAAARQAGLVPGATVDAVGIHGTPRHALGLLEAGALPCPAGLLSAAPLSGGRVAVRVEALPMGEAPVRVRMIGGLQVTAADGSAACEGSAPDRLMQLLCKAAAGAGQWVPRSEIARTLWPGGDDEQHRSAVSRLLGRLGELDSRLGLGPGSPAVLLLGGGAGGSVRLNTAAVSCDITDFLALTQVKGRLLAAGDAVGAGRVAERIIFTLLVFGRGGVRAPGLEGSRELARIAEQFAWQLPWLLARAAGAALRDGRPRAVLQACRIALEIMPEGVARRQVAEHAVKASLAAGDPAFSQGIYHSWYVPEAGADALTWADLASQQGVMDSAARSSASGVQDADGQQVPGSGAAAEAPVGLPRAGGDLP